MQIITPVKVEERQKLGLKPGDTVRVHQKIIEKGKTRTQIFEGLVLAIKHGKEAGATFTVRATLSGIGVERIFPLYAPFIEKIEIVKRSKVRRAKLYFIREKVSREVRRQLRNMRMMGVSTDDFVEKEVPAEEVTPVEEGLLKLLQKKHR
jgi:large subunit ribosomal protein L19